MISHPLDTNYYIKMTRNIEYRRDVDFEDLEQCLHKASYYEKIYIDLSDINFVNSVLLDSLITFCKRYNIEFRDVHLINVPETVLKILFSVNLNEVFTIHYTYHEHELVA